MIEGYTDTVCGKLSYTLSLRYMIHTHLRSITYIFRSGSWQVVAVCVVVAIVATVNAYPGYYGHGGHNYISAGVEEDKHVSIIVYIL